MKSVHSHITFIVIQYLQKEFDKQTYKELEEGTV